MTSAAPTNPVALLPGIEPVRGFAALSVLVLHVVEIGQWQSFPRSGPLAWFRVGWLGVDIFFVISGLVVTLALLRERERDPQGGTRRFLIRRAARIAPLYLLTGLVALLIIDPSPVLGADAGFQVATHLLFLHNLFPSTAGSINGPSVSIGTEVQLYLMLAVLGAWLARARPLVVGAIFLALAPAYRWLNHLWLTGPGSSNEQFASHIATQAPGMSDAFGLGIAMALLLRQGRLPAPGPRAWFACLLAAIVALGVCQVTLFALEPDYWRTTWSIVGFRSLSAIASALLVFAAVRVPDRVMHALPRLLTYLGTISYGIYLWHMPVLAVMLLQLGLQRGWLLIATLAGTLVLAVASWEGYERRWIEIGRRWSMPKRAGSN